MAQQPKYELNELQIAEIREIFTLFDKNSDGLVNTSELGTIVRALSLNPTEQEVDSMKKSVDPNNTGSFDQNSLISLIGRRARETDTLDSLIDALRVFDQDKDGKLSVEEFKYAMTSLGEQMKPDEVEEIITDTELIYDGYLYIEEFAKMMMNR